MLSKKLAFSLLSLTILFALAVTTPTALAAENINVRLLEIQGPMGTTAVGTSGTGGTQNSNVVPVGKLMDVSRDGGMQVERPQRGGDINGGTPQNGDAHLFLRFRVAFDRAVKLAAGNLQITGYNQNGFVQHVELANIAAAQLQGTAAHSAIRGEGGATSKFFWIDVTLQPKTTNPAWTNRTDVTRVHLRVKKGIASADLFNGDTTKELNVVVDLLSPNPGPIAAAGTGNNARSATTGGPDVYRIALAGEPYSPITSTTFQIEVLLSEEPNGGFKKDHLAVSNADIQGDPLKLATPTTLGTIVRRTRAAGLDPRFGQDIAAGGQQIPTRLTDAGTWRDGNIHLYLVTLKSKPGDQTVTISVKDFIGKEAPTGALSQETYVRGTTLYEGRDKLTLKTKQAGTPASEKQAGLRFALPKDKVIPGNGYLVVTEDKGGSAIKVPPGDIAKSPNSAERTPVQRLYNVIDDGDLPNLETFLSNGGVIDVVGPRKLTITEVMWGSDASLDDPGKSQWIELHNPGGEYKTQDGGNTTYLIFYNPSELASLPAKSSVKDRIGTVTAAGAYWSIAGKGQSGRTGQGEQAKGLAATVATSPLISMYRMADSDGQMAGSWMQSTPPSLNFDASKVGIRVGSPGAARIVTQAERDAAAAAAKAREAAAAAAAERAADKSVSMPKVGKIYISEVMFAGGGNLPQWIEIANGSRTEQVNLGGWTLKIENAAADADVSVGSSIMFTLPNGTMLDPSAQKKKPSTVLVVTTAGRNNLPGAMARGQVINVWDRYQTELILAGVANRRYSLLSDMGFMITLAPPAPAAAAGGSTPAAQAAAKAANAKAMRVHAAATDMVGNLGADGAAMWDLPMMEGARSSIIRRHIPVTIGPAEPEDGTMMMSWKLAADTGFVQGTHGVLKTYYGDRSDVGTPGFRAGGALPVELSSFRPERQDTGAVVITWSTQSELNNAGFFIKRSQQRNGEFKVINAVMVPGAGTTSEKQTYTYTDTTAAPNIVYYYQIEDVSLDGQRETLTRGVRLRGHIGAAGKATVLWGELKGSHE